MSWMDSWSRPGKSQAVPAPYYLLPGVGETTPYCRSCGRVINSRRTEKAAATNNDGSPAGGKYCSARCRHSKPSKLDREIEEVFVKLLLSQSVEDVVAERMAMRPASAAAHGQDQQHGNVGGGDLCKVTSSTAQQEDAENKIKERAAIAAQKGHKRQKSKAAKGDGRILVPCDQVEEIVFGSRADPVKVFGRKKNRASRVIQGQGSDEEGGNHTGGSQQRKDWAHRLTSRRPANDHADESGGDSAVELDDDDFDGFDSDSDDFGLGRTTSGAANNNNNNTDGHTVAAMSIRSGDRVRPAQTVSEVNGSVGGEKGWAERSAESEEMALRRIEGQQRAQRKEMVRCAARRLVVFGYTFDEDRADGRADRDAGDNNGGGGGGGGTSHNKKKKKSSRAKGSGSNHGNVDDTDGGGGSSAPPTRKCEAVMQGKVVEPSYAKGSWSVRWRED